MSIRRFFGGAFILVLLAGGFGVFMQHRWPLMSQTQQGAYQEFFTIFTGMLGFFFLVMGTYAAFQSAEASRRQAIAADRQAEAADKQAASAETQISVAKATLKEQIRPVLTMEFDWQTEEGLVDAASYVLRNIGTGAALNLEVEVRQGPRDIVGTFRTYKSFIIVPGQTKRLPFKKLFVNFRVFYEDVEGGRHMSVFAFWGGEMHTSYGTPDSTVQPAERELERSDYTLTPDIKM